VPDWIIIMVRKDGTLGYIPTELERWRKAIEEFVEEGFHKLPPADPEYVFFVRAMLIEVEEPTLIQQLCRAPATAVKCHKLVGNLWREVQS
jgi:hypothetical protein